MNGTIAALLTLCKEFMATLNRLESSVSSIPVSDLEVLLRHWEFAGDSREVRLLRNSEHRLICQVFDRNTQQFRRRLLENSGSEDYEEKFLRLLRPELVTAKIFNPLAVIFIRNNRRVLHKWILGPQKNIEAVLFRACLKEGKNDKTSWAVIDTATNKFNTWEEEEITDERVATLVRNFFLEIKSDLSGLPTSVIFCEKIFTFVDNQKNVIYCIRKENGVECQVFDAKKNQIGSHSLNQLNALPADIIAEILSELEPEIFPAGPLGLKAMTGVVARRKKEPDTEFAIFRKGDQLGVRFFDKVAKVSQLIFNIPGLEHIPDIEERIHYLKGLEPFVIYEDSLPDRIEFKPFKSNVDQKTVLDLDSWAITLVSAGKCHLENPITWGGHAMLLIEGVEDKGYFIELAHLTFDRGLRDYEQDNNDDVLAGILELKVVPCIPAITSLQDKIICQNNQLIYKANQKLVFEQKTETWKVVAERVRLLLRKIQLDIAMQKDQLMFRYLHPAGSESLMVEPVRAKVWNSLVEWKAHLKAVHAADREKGLALTAPLVHSKGKMPKFVIFAKLDDVREWEDTDLASYRLIVSNKIKKSKAEQYVMPENCIDWSSQNLQIAGVNLPRAFFRKLFHVPKEHTLMSSLFGFFGLSRNNPEPPVELSEEEIRDLQESYPETVNSQLVLLACGVRSSENRNWRRYTYSLFGYPLWISYLPEEENVPEKLDLLPSLEEEKKID